jgi:hypothetical protein
LSAATAGAVVQTIAGNFTAGQFIWRIGKALSATTIQFDPQFLLEY